MHTRRPQPISLGLLAFCGSLALPGVVSQAALLPHGGDDAADERIIVGPLSPHGFNPKDAAGVDIDVETLNFRLVFEALDPDAALWYQHVVTLANPYFEGRAPGLEGNRRAADYIEWWFREFGLEPAFPDPDLEETPGGGVAEGAWVSYRQPFSARGRETDNVGGVLRGRGDLAEQWVVIGGHYDHVGYGNFNPLNKAGGTVHPGADDNASGTAGVLILAQRFAKAYAEAPEGANIRSILFMGFSAEEMGLIGSRHYTRNSTLDADHVNIMINLDMIGRLRSDTMMIGGVGTAEGLLEKIRPHLLATGLTIHADPSGRGPSDHSNFYGAGIPVLFFFTGVHDAYHRPGDTGLSVNPVGALRVINMAYDIAWDAIVAEEPLVYVQQAPPAGRRAARERVTLGIAPDGEADLPAGVLIGQVFEDSVAEEAGLQVGDVLLKWGDEELDDMRALSRRLRGMSAGDTVTLTILRDGKELEVGVQFREE